MYTTQQLIDKGYLAPNRKVDFEMAPFCLSEDWKYLPLVVQIRYADEVTNFYSGDTEIRVHHLKQFDAKGKRIV